MKRRKLDQFLSQRRKSQDIVLAETAQLSSRVLRLAVVGLLTFFLAMLVQPPNLPHAIGLGVLFVVLTALGGLHLHRLDPGGFDRAALFSKFILLILVSVLCYRFIAFMGWSPFLVPLPMFAMIVTLAYSQGTALVTVLAFGFFVGLTSPGLGSMKPAGETGLSWRFPVDYPLMLALTVGALTAILGVRRVRKQARPFVVGVYAGLVQGLCVVALQLMTPGFDLASLAEPDKIPGFLRDPGWALAGGLISGATVTCLLGPIEEFFDILTERRLLDLADPSNDLLRVLRERAPGTYQHTFGVAQLASNAAEAIGANRLLAEVGAYYHDVGKIFKPEYFVENMSDDRGIHDRLRPNMSKLVIISHVKDGMELAREMKLPQQLMDMIPMHHGTTVVEYFYQKARRETGDPEDAPVDDEYRYPGAKPRFREAGILMLADMIEAIAKTETEPNPARFRAMVHDQILKRLLDGQLNESDLTLNDLRLVEDSFVRTLTTMYHSRIKYPVAEVDPAKRRLPASNGRPEAAPGGERRMAAP